MPRRGQISKRDVLPDPLYNSKLVTKLINNIMYDGKKGVAQKIVYDAFAIVESKLGRNPLEAFNEALEIVMPVLEVKARRVGGSTYQVPMEVRAERRQTLGLRWITTYQEAAVKDYGREACRRDCRRNQFGGRSPSRRRKKPIEWQRQTRRSHTTDINSVFDICEKAYVHRDVFVPLQCNLNSPLFLEKEFII